MNKIKITVLTDPLLHGKNLLFGCGKYIIKSLMNLLLEPKSFYYGFTYGGHSAVTRSLLTGFSNCKIDFNYNPKNIRNLSDTVLVLAGVRALKQAIYFKKKGYIKKIFAGPNIATFTKDENYLLGSPEIDLLIVPSEWVRSVYLEDIPSLKDKIFVWPAGVDINYWSPIKNNKNRILIYNKYGNFKNDISKYINYLQQSSLKFDIVENSKKKSYTSQKYKDLLQNARLVVGFTGGSESQGIAWAEAWAMNVPTLIQSKSSNIISGRNVLSSTAPYLCSYTGLFFNNFDDFINKLEVCMHENNKFFPRKWIIDNMSDEVVAQKLYKKILSC
jgi:hypothetical protein